MIPSTPALIEEFGLLWKCLPPAEVVRLRAILSVLPELDPRFAAEIEEVFRFALRSLPPVAEAIQSCPNVLQLQRLGGRERSTESLIDTLCHSEELNIEFLMPTGAILGRAFVLARLNFLKALGYLLDGAGARAAEAAANVKESIADAVFSKLAEELLTATISNSQNPMDLKRAAAQKLVAMWSNRLQLPVGEFPPVLLSAWKARVKVRAIFGTLIGVNEVFSLIQAECESRFVTYFARDHVTCDEQEAFREFLFGLSYEDLQQVRVYMDEHNLKVISPAEVRRLLTTNVPSPILGDPSPEQIYNAYCRRRLRAEYRCITGSPGPRKTAEGYIMESLLREETGQKS
ncbi:MAG TPA: hypothetical protein VMT52_19395 [Planctomycetota bacterium]|nr:hypothetical protein [Planctomycetota bacterium]